MTVLMLLMSFCEAARLKLISFLIARPTTGMVVVLGTFVGDYQALTPDIQVPLNLRSIFQPMSGKGAETDTY